MTKDNYLRAKHLQDKISQLEFDINALNEQLKSNNLLIRFGGQFNVSAPIEIDKDDLVELCNRTKIYKAKLLALAKQEFNSL